MSPIQFNDLPDETLFQILDNLEAKDLKHCRCLNKKLNSLGEDPNLRINLLASHAFGKQKWDQYIGAVDEEVPIPENFIDVLRSNKDKYILLFLPRSIEKQPLTYSNFQKLITNKFPVIVNLLPQIFDQEKDTANTQARWMLIPKENLPESLEVKFDDKIKIIKEMKGYKLPGFLSTFVALCCHYVWTQKMLFINNPTICEEKLFGYHITVNSDGSQIYINNYPRDYCGIAPCKLS